MVARVVQGRAEIRESLLEFTELAKTLQRYLDSALGITKTTAKRPDPLVTRWQKGSDLPELLLTTTDLNATRLMLFWLVSVQAAPTARSRRSRTGHDLHGSAPEGCCAAGLAHPASGPWCDFVIAHLITISQK